MSHEMPADTHAKLQAAIALQQQGRLAQAGALYMDVLRTHPDHPDCLNLLGVLAARAGQHATALALIDRAIAVYPGDASFHTNRGNVLRDLKQPDAALASFDHAIALRPDDADAHFNRGVALQDLGRPADALGSYDRALGIDARHAHAWHNRGNALLALGDPASATDSHDRALAIDPAYVLAWQSRGHALAALGRPDAAVDSFDRAIALDPSDAAPHYNRGTLQKTLGRFDAALASFEAALRLQPDHAEARWNLSLLLLLVGRVREGWTLYESRWQTPSFRAPRRDFGRPLWLGDAPLDGRTILLHHDQGLGDAIQFSRYATPLAARGARVVLEVPAPLVALLRDVEGVADVIRTGDPLPAFDCHCPLSSLPLALRSDLDCLPAAPAYLRADPGKVRGWEARLGPATRPRVGVVAAGNPHHANDAHRSVDLGRLLETLLRGQPAGVDVVLLQKDLRDADRAALAAHPAVRDASPWLLDFTDTAALCAQMDVVVSVDTSVAHLAAALGKPTWIMLPFVPDWRWLLDRADSPWYPSARLYRQAALSDWDAVFGRIAADLAGLPCANSR